MWTWLLLAACGGDPGSDTATPDTRVCGTDAPSVVALMNRITFAREEDGVSWGFDLDGEESSAGGASGCGVGDLVDPDGRGGVDNAFARLMPALELTEAQAVEGIIQETINAGQLLLFVEIEDVHDRHDDGCVHLTLQQGTGAPVVGGHGLVVSGQTFERDPDGFASRVEDIPIVGGSVEAGPLSLELPVTVFAVDLVFALNDVRIRVDLRDDGTFWGYLGGGLVIEDILEVARRENVDPSLAGTLEGLLGLAADLDPQPDGSCAQISVTLEFEGVSAFFF